MVTERLAEQTRCGFLWMAILATLSRLVRDGIFANLGIELDAVLEIGADDDTISVPGRASSRTTKMTPRNSRHRIDLYAQTEPLIKLYGARGCSSRSALATEEVATRVRVALDEFLDAKADGAPREDRIKTADQIRRSAGLVVVADIHTALRARQSRNDDR